MTDISSEEGEKILSNSIIHIWDAMVATLGGDETASNRFMSHAQHKDGPHVGAILITGKDVPELMREFEILWDRLELRAMEKRITKKVSDNTKEVGDGPDGEGSE